MAEAGAPVMSTDTHIARIVDRLRDVACNARALLLESGPVVIMTKKRHSSQTRNAFELGVDAERYHLGHKPSTPEPPRRGHLRIVS
jgi:hypothetical protein